ncbi:uncharacterized protein [Haliotis asinina]|uniref:uncharacterized protein n=1 Tax=Haliotis asinina TaxID=109174 RepID=UPI003531C740
MQGSRVCCTLQETVNQTVIMPRLNEAQRNDAIGRLEAGETRSDVAMFFNVPPSTISRLWERYQQHGSTRDLPRSGRPRVTTAAQDRYIRLQHLSQRTTTAASTASTIPGHRRISDQTMRNRERFAQNCVQEVDRFGRGSVMVGATISHNAKTSLLQVRGNLTAKRYVEEILRPHVVPIMANANAVFQQDNARPHTARIIMAYLVNNNVNVLPWPSRSTDLKPIEHLSDELDRRVRRRHAQPQTLQQVTAALTALLATIPLHHPSLGVT